MTLERRLVKLEAARGGADVVAQDAAAFLDRLGALVAAVQAGGDFTESEAASPAVRYCRALLRGDGATAEAVLRKALGGLS